MLKQRNKSYISELDKFLAEFDQQYPDRSDSQQKEFTKHQRVVELRDKPQSTESKNKLWSGF